MLPFLPELLLITVYITALETLTTHLANPQRPTWSSQLLRTGSHFHMFYGNNVALEKMEMNLISIFCGAWFHSAYIVGNVILHPRESSS